MTSTDQRGQRLLASLIDSYAVNEPGRTWASVPVDEEDLSKGFKDVTYKQFANAISCAAWWIKEKVGGTTGDFETLAYAGPKDLRYPLLAVAVVKCEKKVESPLTNIALNLTIG